jgi:hypothetical protein
MVWGNSYIYTANNSSQLSIQIKTDKVRIAPITAIAISVGNSGVTANLTNSTIIPGGTVERSFYVGQGNYIAYIDASGATARGFSVTELGMNHANTGT